MYSILKLIEFLAILSQNVVANHHQQQKQKTNWRAIALLERMTDIGQQKDNVVYLQLVLVLFFNAIIMSLWHFWPPPVKVARLQLPMSI